MSTQSHENAPHLENTVSEISAPRSLGERLFIACGIVGPILFTATYLIEGAIRAMI